MEESAQQELERLRAENEKLRAGNHNKEITCKVSVKGALSVYGLGRFPVTLYRGQWERLLAKSPDILQFIDEHTASLATKD